MLRVGENNAVTFGLPEATLWSRLARFTLTGLLLMSAAATALPARAAAKEDTQPAATPAAAESPAEPFLIEGFRSAHWGMTDAQVRAAIRKDFNIAPEAVRSGLGQVYEQGRGDYDKAVSCYVEAARHGNVNAKYRLALIKGAGNEKIEPDLTEAYKWAVLATDTKDNQTTRLAIEMRRLLEDNLSIADQRQARARAEQWKSELQANANTNSGCLPREIAAPAVPVSAPPTLPSAAAASAPAPPAPSPSSAVVEQSAAVAGPPPPAPPTSTTSRDLGDSLAVIERIRANGSGGKLRAQLQTGDAILPEGQPIRIDVTAPQYPVYLRFDYFSLDGKVLHMLPNSQQRTVRLDNGSRRIFGGDARQGEDWAVGGEPFGTEAILVTATPQPLEFWPPRPDLEMAKDYLQVLRDALGRGASRSGQPNALATVLIRTRAR